MTVRKNVTGPRKIEREGIAISDENVSYTRIGTDFSRSGDDALSILRFKQITNFRMECRNSIKTALKGRRGEERSKKPKSSFCNNSKRENIYIKTKKMAREVGRRGEMSQLDCGVPLSTGNIFGNILRLLRSFSSNYKAPNGSNC